MQQVGLQGVDLFVTYSCNRRICLLEFFILKKKVIKKWAWTGQGKKKTNMHLQNINKIKTKQVKATAARV